MKSLIKPAILTGLIILLMIPLSMIEGVIGERTQNRGKVVNDIAESWTRSQTVSGPWLFLDYQVKTEQKQWNQEKEVYEMTPEIKRKRLLLRPTTNDMTGNLEVSHRYRGIFQVPVYTADMSISAQFDLALLHKAFNEEEGAITVTGGSIEFSVTDARGFVASPVLHWNGVEIESHPGTSNLAANGFQVPLDINLFNSTTQEKVDLIAEFQLRGV